MTERTKNIFTFDGNAKLTTWAALFERLIFNDSAAWRLFSSLLLDIDQ